ncbi:MAG: hypothetical protein IV094_12515 [Vitreoscilla sp.]|nr:hypothetical protein [Vitreoscilla sp.]
MNRFPMTPFLRTVLRADAVLSTLTMLALVADAEPLSAWLGVPAATLRIAGIALLPWVGYLVWLSRLDVAPPAALWVAVGGNAVWAVECAAMAFGFGLQPDRTGQALLAVQSVGGLVLAELEWVGFRRACARPGLS